MSKKHSTSSDTWSATHATNPSPPHLTVTGEITLPTPGYTVTLKKAHPQGTNPSILLLDKVVKAPTGTEPDHVVHQTVTFTEHTSAHYTEVTILPDDVTVKVIQI